MTNKQKFIHALERRPPLKGRVPHFEPVFFLTMEAFGKVHPKHRNYYQWDQMEKKERQLHLEDMAEVKKLAGDKVCLIGNVSCALMDTGTDEEVIESAKYALKHGMPNGGYIFSTSNCIYTGMRLKRYEQILEVWRREGNYE